jgi:hypothetical protein
VFLMDKPVYIDFQTKICSAALNQFADTVWDALGEAKTPSEARQFIGAVEEAPNDGKSYLRASLGWLEAATALSHNQLGGRSVSDAHPTSAITGLDTTLAGKASVVHTHVAADIVGGFTAGQVSFVPGGTIVSSDVQNAINELDADTQLSLGQKQPTLVSGSNIKTINGSSIVGSGDLAVTSSDPTKLPLTGGTLSGALTVQTVKISGSGSLGNIGTASEDALQIDATAKTIAAITPYLLVGKKKGVTATPGAGQVGEVVQFTANSPSPSSGSFATIGSAALTAGVWLLFGTMSYSITTGPCQMRSCGFGSTSTGMEYGNALEQYASNGGFTGSMVMPLRAVFLTVAQTIYAVGRATFTGGSIALASSCFAVRIA